MIDDVGIGLVLHADREFLGLVRPLLRDVDYLEVTPETLWRWTPDGGLVPNGYHARVLALGRGAGLPFAAHGVGLSLGGVDAADRARQDLWLARIRADHAAFGFRWYSEHLGATMLGGHHVCLPCPVPMTARHAGAVRDRLARLRDVVGHAAIENTASHFTLGDPLDEPSLIAAATDGPGLHLLLDLHNLHAMATNLGFDPHAYLARLPLERVIEIHLAGGGASNPAWLPSGRALVLDAHDRRVPEPVWALLDEVLPRCRALRGVTIERMDGTLAVDEVPELRDELGRARRAVRASRMTRPARAVRSTPRSNPLPEGEWSRDLERAYGAALCAADPASALRALADDRECPSTFRTALARADSDGIRMTGLLIAKARFERLLNGSGDAIRWFVGDGPGFAAAFRAYHYGEQPTEHAPAGEARRFHAWHTHRAPG
jgi:uncharacterized protein (UPF0276 family)